MTELQKAAQMALEALRQYTDVVTSENEPNSWVKVVDGGKPARDAIEALRAALAQPEQEPVWGDSQVTKPEIVAEQKAMNESLRKMVEQEPPQREWQGLTDEEYESMAEKYVTNYFFDTLKYARAIETKLKVKNGNF
jgi:hypothetical protein